MRGLVLGLLLAGCAIVPSYRTELEEPGRFVVTYFDDALDASRSRQADVMAGQHCAKYGKGATLVRSDLRKTDYRTVAAYYCR